MTTRYTIALSKLAKSKFDQIFLASQKLGRQIAKAIDRIAQNPQLGEHLKGEWKAYRKYRSGSYRIIYRIEHSQLIIYVITIDDRKDVYR